MKGARWWRTKPPRVLRHLGSGGMGEVFLATVERDGAEEKVALKRPHRHLARQREWLRQFQREGELGARLSHENIVAVRAVGEDRDGPFLALEYVEGWSLRQILTAARLSGRQMPLHAALAITDQLARGLVYLHELPPDQDGQAGLLHRDVSPENVLVSRSGCAKLSDFGLAKSRSGGTTTAGLVRGKFGFLAPELYEGKPGSLRSDLFALAVTVYELVVGQRPFEGATDAELMRATLFSAPVRMASLRAGVPSGVDDWVFGALSREPQARPASARSLIEALAPADPHGEGRTTLKAFLLDLEQSGAFQTGVRASTAPAEAARPKPRRLALWLAGCVAAAALAGTLAIPALRHENAPMVLAPVQPAQPAPPPAPAPDPQPTPPPSEVPSPPPPAAPAKPKPARKTQTQEGGLWIRVAPWAEVFVDGSYVGVTPLPALKLTPGAHHVLLVNKELSVHRNVDVKVEPGATATLRVDLTRAQ